MKRNQICCDVSAHTGDCCSNDDCEDRHYCDFHICTPMPAECGDGLCENDKGESCLNCQEDCLGAGEICCGGFPFSGNCCSDSDCGTHMKNESCMEALGCNNHVCVLREHPPEADGCCDISFSVSTDNCSATEYRNDSLCGAGKFCGDNCTCEINDCTALPAYQCLGQCAWCPLDKSCKPAAQVACTEKKCLNSSYECSESCTVTYCPGNDQSCYCAGGECRSCTSDKDCVDRKCIEIVEEVTEPETTPVSCEPKWECSEWSMCFSSNTKVRTCKDTNSCGKEAGKPSESMECDYLAEQSKEIGISEQTGGTSGGREETAGLEPSEPELLESMSNFRSYGTIAIIVLALGLIVAYVVYNKSSGLHILTGAKEAPPPKPVAPVKPKHSTMPMLRPGERYIPAKMEERRTRPRPQPSAPRPTKMKKVKITRKLPKSPAAVEGLRKTIDKSIKKMDILKDIDKRVVKRKKKR
jgi:hypothetical protein